MPGSQTLKIPGHFATILMSSQLGAARMPLIYKKEWPGKILPCYPYISLSREAEGTSLHCSISGTIKTVLL